VWKLMAVLICCRPAMTRLFTKSRNAAVSGAENRDGPRYRELAGLLLEPPQQPQR
jgi:hypothetical protein